MVQAPQRTALSGPALIRLLARLTDVEFTESAQSLSDRLSQWLHWTDAIALSTALGGMPAAGNPMAGNSVAGNPVGVAKGVPTSSSPEENEYAAVRGALANTIASDSVFGAPKKRPGAGGQVHIETNADYPVFRQGYLTLQQSMETAIGNLRGRLRAKLALRTPATKRLAEVDAVMERALSPRERTLLGTVPTLLGKHFERLRRAEQDTLTGDHPAGAWLEIFRKDAQSVLLAELDLRFQPVEGLLAALRTS
ncbi:hypothetical protein ASG35_09780 [Burkholderia sp. Leaf177]|uniref:DUF3348 domain-containing protein n=1 Tax=Burkholderia sp. Leaf177 TaxID=1736287 RepID=UPI0006FDDF61|nr:DUF3348 domain-containing protein [Burkholderia sp. Leaf177]KQR78676.1 hypothetical protein ASG35_09780 [Burkholderia sp. Leaf177]